MGVVSRTKHVPFAFEEVISISPKDFSIFQFVWSAIEHGRHERLTSKFQVSVSDIATATSEHPDLALITALGYYIILHVQEYLLGQNCSTRPAECSTQQLVS